MSLMDDCLRRVSNSPENLCFGHQAGFFGKVDLGVIRTEEHSWTGIILSMQKK